MSRPVLLPYPPPFQDKATLAQHLCLGETTIDEYVQSGLLPPPRRGRENGRLLWNWAEVAAIVASWPVAGAPTAGAQSPTIDRAEGVRRAAQRASRGTAA